MTDTILTMDGGVSAFDSATGAVDSDDGGVTFNWDERHIVNVDAPADLQGAFDTDRFYKIEGATIARPIKQPYLVGDEFEVYKKPAGALQRAAWSFDNAPFTLGHPESGMVKNVDDIHGFWRNPRYDADEDRLKEDLYVPVEDDEALAFIEDNADVSVGFYNRVTDSYDGDTGDLTDDDVDGFQVQMYGDHIAGVEEGRCSDEDGCGLDSDDSHGEVVGSADQSTSFVSQRGNDIDFPTWEEGDMVRWQANPEMTGKIVATDEDRKIVMVELMDGGEESGYTLTAGYTDLRPMDGSMDSACGCGGTTDAPSGIHEGEDGGWYGIAPSETADDEPKYELDNCNDVKDAWNLRGSGDYDVEQSTLESRIKRAADAHDCPPEQKPWDDNETNDTMTDDNEFDIPDLSVDALAEKNDAISELKAERDELQQTVDEMESEIEDALDSAETFTVQLDEDECVCEAVEDLVSELDEKAETAEKVEELQDELKEYREEERTEALDTLEDLGADRDEYEDADLDTIEEEIDRREEVLDAADVDTSVKTTEDSGGDDEGSETTMGRTFGRGYNA